MRKALLFIIALYSSFFIPHSPFSTLHAQLLPSEEDLPEVIKRVCRRADGTSSGTPVVGPLLTSQWGQDSPYNLFTPQVGRKQAAVGCVATALAQIMNYWKWPNQGNGVMSYSTPYGTLVSDFGAHTYAWDILTDVVNNSSPEEVKNAVAQLCYDCGVAVKMDYGDSSSSSTDAITYALYNYFGYKASTLHYYFHECMPSEQEWMNIIKRELDANRPIQIRAYSASGGHSFIIDGYDSNNFVHVNWGWNGHYDGYYDLNLLNPGSDIFNDGVAVLTGIEPDYTGTDKLRQQVPIYIMSAPRTTWTQRKVTQFFTVTVDTVFNYRSSGRTYTDAVGLYDVSGRFIADVIQESSRHTNFFPGFKGTYSYGSLSCKLNDSVQAVIQDGDYVLKVLFREDGYDEFILPDMVGGQQRNQIPVYIHDGVMDFNTYSAAIETPTFSSLRSSSVYDMNGRQVKEDIKIEGSRIGNINVLPKGIYIVNGKKVLFKE